MKNLLILLAILAAIYFVIARPYVRIHNGAELDEFFSGEIKGGQGVNGTAHYLSDEYLTIHHKLFYFIPLYDDHYRLVFSDDMSHCIAVRASKKFINQFDENGYSEEGVAIKGYIKKAPWEGFFGFNYSPHPSEAIQARIEYWHSIGYYPEIETVYYIEPRPFFNLRTVSTIMDFISYAIIAIL